jgi:hypothetical protein
MKFEVGDIIYLKFAKKGFYIIVGIRNNEDNGGQPVLKFDRRWSSSDVWPNEDPREFFTGSALYGISFIKVT